MLILSEFCHNHYSFGVRMSAKFIRRGFPVSDTGTIGASTGKVPVLGASTSVAGAGAGPQAETARTSTASKVRYFQSDFIG